MNGTELLSQSLREIGEPACIDAANEIDALAARLAEAERDAARYRWLRNTTNWPWSVRAATGEDFDLAVDYCLRPADTAPACLGRNVKDEPLPRCEAYPKCPCGGLEGWTDDSAAGEKHE